MTIEESDRINDGYYEDRERRAEKDTGPPPGYFDDYLEEDEDGVDGHPRVKTIVVDEDGNRDEIEVRK